MFRKNVGHFVVVSLKFFFDCDYSLCNHAFIIVLLLAGICKLFIGRITTALYDGALTVKEDILHVKEGIAAYKERWDNSPLRENVVSNVRLLKNNFFEINVRN